MPKPIIDWLQILNNVNADRKKRKRPTFDNLKDMFQCLCHEKGMTSQQMANSFRWEANPSHTSVLHKMYELGVKAKSPGHTSKREKPLRNLHPERWAFWSEEALLRTWRIKTKFTYREMLKLFALGGVEIGEQALCRRLRKYGIILNKEELKKKRQDNMRKARDARKKGKAVKE